MPHVALLGAGFSRNWGGWLAAELLGELLGRVIADPVTYNLLRGSKNFEDTLAELQIRANNRKTAEAIERLEKYEEAILETFSEMNNVFASFPGWGLSNDASLSIDKFLGNFDAIFTLNQDLLIELHYHAELGGSPRWCGYDFPGMAPQANYQQLNNYEKLNATWSPLEEISDSRHCQPIYKLHGSVNWSDPHGDHLMVMGGRKYLAIDNHPILKHYFNEFNNILAAGDTKLMVIGYGFNDNHINQLLINAGNEHNMQMHVVDPRGIDLLKPSQFDQIPSKSPLEDIPIIGETKRTLKEILSSNDKIAFQSLNRFFN